MSDVLLQVGAQAGAVAAILRGLVPILRSPMGGLIWNKIPGRYRAYVLLGLAMALGVANYAAFGTPLDEAVFAALGGFMGAVTTHEVGDRSKAPKPDAPAPPPPALKHTPQEHTLNRPDVM